MTLMMFGFPAFVCETCGRRFGVASNLNRHVRRCILKPVNTPPSASGHESASGSPPAHGDSPAIAVPSHAQAGPSDQIYHRRIRVPSPSSSNTPPSNGSDHTRSPHRGSARHLDVNEKPKPVAKRRRRAPSPSQWIPGSLLSFNLKSEDFFKSTSVPMPPVRRNLPREERDSWDENVSITPYHPNGWKGVLPGPGLGQGFGLGGKDVRNIDFGGVGGFMLGRVLVR